MTEPLHCLFCFWRPPDLKSSGKVLEDVIGNSGKSLKITLDNPSKNREAFKLLCDRLNIDSDNNEISALNQGNSLPLCIKCQILHQEMYHLHQQIQELEKLLMQRAELIKTIILRSDEQKVKQQTEVKKDLSNARLINAFRSRVVNRTRGDILDCSQQKSGILESRGEEKEDRVSTPSLERRIQNVKDSGSGNAEDIEWNEGTEEVLDNDGSDEDLISRPLRRPKVKTPGHSSRTRVRRTRTSSTKSSKTISQTKSNASESDASNPKKTFTCHICDEVFNRYIYFRRHYQELHPDEKRYTCKYCKRFFKDLKNIHDHQRTHTGEKVYECRYCQKKLATKKSLKGHIKAFHEKDSHGAPNRFACNQCSKTFPTKPRLNAHLESHSDLVVICEACGDALKSEKNFRIHNKRMHEGQAKCSKPIDPHKEAPEADRPVPLKSNARVNCHVCQELVLGKNGVPSHFKKVHPDLDPKQCHVCGKTFPNVNDCRKHTRRMHNDERPFQCDQCPSRYLTNSELKIHAVVHLPEADRKKYACDLCPSVFSVKANFDAHMKNQHQNNPGLVCEQCGKSLPTRKSYNQHKNVVHATNRPHKCSQCSFDFVTAWDLKRHMRKHTNQRPYKCRYCDMTFAYTSSRSRHTQKVHKEQRSRGTFRIKLNESRPSALEVIAESPPAENPQPSSPTVLSLATPEGSIQAEYALVETESKGGIHLETVSLQFSSQAGDINLIPTQ